MTQRQANEHFNIPRRTLVYTLKKSSLRSTRANFKIHKRRRGCYHSTIETMSTYGFLLTEFDFEISIKICIEKCGRIVKNFKITYLELTGGNSFSSATNIFGAFGNNHKKKPGNSKKRNFGSIY